MSVLESLTLIAPIAFIVGFAMQRGNVCSVLAARQIVTTGHWSRLRGLLLASGWGGVVLLFLVWMNVGPFALSPQMSPTLITAIAGSLYGAGCYINGACIFGVCSRVTAGHISFLFAIPAMAVGAILGQHSGLAPTKENMSATMIAEPTLPLMLIWLVVAVFLIWSLIRLVANYKKGGVKFSKLLVQSRWRSGLAALLIGVFGAVLFATNAAWFYPAAAKRLATYLFGFSDVFPRDSVIGAGFVFLGGITAALYKGRVLIRPPHLIPSVKAIAGGLVIGFAWALIPGGNDAMVLYLLPSLALNGIVAYAAMFATLIVLERWKMKASW